MIQILYTADHAERGNALGASVPLSHNGLISTTPVAIAGLDTLTFWGHGTFVNMCDLNAHALGSLIKSWKKLNPKLKTVEILTCNARHTAAGNDAYVTQLKAELKSGVLSSTRNMVVKALPVDVRGSMGGFSILLAHAPNKSWCYITAGGANDTAMMQGSNMIKAVSKTMGYNLAEAANKVATSTGYTDARADKQFAAMNPNRQFTLTYGYFRDLRESLVVIK